MVHGLYNRNQAAQVYIRALSSAWKNGVQLWDTSVWNSRDPDVEAKMLRDADIAHAIGFRRHLIAGRQWTLLPKDKKNPASKLAVQVGTALLKRIKNFTGARANLAKAFLPGSRFARIHGETKPATLGDGKVRNWWFPRRLEDIDKKRYRIVPRHDPQGGALSAHWECWDLGRQEWVPESERSAIDVVRHIYDDDEASLGYGRGLLDALGWWWYAKEHVFQESLAACERFAQGILVAKVGRLADADTGKPNDELVSAWTDVLENMRSRHVLVMGEDDKVEHVQMNGEGWQLLKDIRAELKATILTLILGANLTTAAAEGGSYALAEIQENSTEALIQFDRESLEETLTDSLLEAVWFHNYANLRELGLQDEKPAFNCKQEKRTDPEKRANVAKAAHEMGLPLAKEEVYEQLGFRVPEEGEEVLEGAEPLDPFGGGGGGAPHPMLAGLFGHKPPAPPQPPPGDEQDDAERQAKAAS